MNGWEIAGRQRHILITGVVLGVLGSAASLAQPLVIGELVRAVERDQAIIWPVAIGVILFGVDAALAGSQGYLIGRAGENIIFDLRRTLTRKLLHSDMAAFDRLDHGDVFTRMVGDTSVARVALSDSVAQIVTSSMMVVGGIALMAWIDAWLLLATLSSLAVASAVSLMLARKVRRTAAVNREDTSTFGSGLHRVLGAMTTVKASRAEEREADAIGALAESARRSGVRVSALTAMFTPAMNIGVQMSFAVVIALGMGRIADGGLEMASLAAFVMYLFYMMSPLVLLFISIGNLQRGRAALDRVVELGATPQENQSLGRRVAVEGRQSIEFEHVTFCYDGDENPTLRDLTFSIPLRGVTALVGPSGSGKTTIFRLIERFYEPDSGSIQLMGEDVARMPLDQVREIVGYVEQEAPLVRGTVRENLVYASPDASDDDIGRVLSLACLEEVIGSLSAGLDTDLGERGSGLSGGQRQRLAVARTLLQDPAVVLFDEATAHLDGESAAVLAQTMTAIAEERAVLTIGHRFRAVSQAEKILLIEGGRLRSSGTHGCLMDEDPLYRRLATATDG